MQENSKAQDALNKIITYFTNDTLQFLANVLSDDLSEPEYSANTAVFSLKQIILLSNALYDAPIETVNDYLKSKGYTEEELQRLTRLQKAEVEEFGDKWGNEQDPEAKECLEYILDTFRSDTFIELDESLSDNPQKRAEAAQTIKDKLECIAVVERTYYNRPINGVTDLLKLNNYSDEVIDLFISQ